MIDNSQKSSHLVPFHIPDFIRENPDYGNFVLFLQAYYEWLDLPNAANSQITTAQTQTSQQGALFGSKNLLKYNDVDQTLNGFIEYYKNDFLSNFPKDALIDERMAIKVARQLYQSKGTPASYKFLFKVLYNSDFDIFYTSDAVLRASAGKWYVPKSLRLATTDPRFLNINNYRLFGKESKTIAVIENSVLAGGKTEVFISNIQRTFISGETIVVLDNDNSELIVNGSNLTAKLVGQISQVNINPNNRGLYYDVGDPVILYNGMESEELHGAVAQIGTTTTGSIQSITLVNGGFGYSLYANTQIEILNAPGANVIVSYVANTANTTLIPRDDISLKQNITIGNTQYNFANNMTANANTTLAEAFTFMSLTLGELTANSLTLVNGGGSVRTPPSMKAVSTYTSLLDTKEDISALGILAPIKIINGGEGYRANDKILFTGGSGFGAYANVISVTGSSNTINVIQYVTPNRYYPAGGMNYRNDALPNVVVVSANTGAFGANIYVPSILGAGAILKPEGQRVGAVTTINVLDYGEDYQTTPNVSIRVQDIVVSNVVSSLMPMKGDVVFQGDNLEVSSFRAIVNSVFQMTTEADPSKQLYNLRVFEYTTVPDKTLDLQIVDKNINMVMEGKAYPANTFYVGSPEFSDAGTKVYGDGNAKATAKFLNGLTIGQGQYLTSQHQPSSFSVLQNEIYNNFTYQITVEKEIDKYRNVLLNLLHPSGMKMLGRVSLRSDTSQNTHSFQAVYQGRPLYAVNGGIGAYGATARITTSNTNKSNNIVKFSNLAGANIANIMFANTTTLILTPTYGPNVTALITNVDYAANQVTLESNTWLTFANVAVATANANSNTINITTITNAYNIINNGVYSNTAYPLMDIVFVGDSVLINGVSDTVTSVDYINGVISVTNEFADNANTYLTVTRNFVANSALNSDQIRIFGPIGTTYIPELITESGDVLLTENEDTILLG